MDNLEELHELFKVVVTDKCAAGWCYRCRKCDVAATTVEFYAPCQDDFVPEKVRCPVCGRRWKLKIDFSEQLTSERVVH